VVLEKDGKDKLGQSSEKCRSNTKSPDQYPTNIKRRRATWISYILSRNCHLNTLLEERWKNEERKVRNDGKTMKKA
jgi:hypothetical protein